MKKGREDAEKVELLKKRGEKQRQREQRKKWTERERDSMRVLIMSLDLPRGICKSTYPD